MALSFDDRLLGEKVDNYCSSGDEGEDSETSSEKEEETEVELPASAEPLSRQVSKVLFRKLNEPRRRDPKELLKITSNIKG